MSIAKRADHHSRLLICKRSLHHHRFLATVCKCEHKPSVVVDTDALDGGAESAYALFPLPRLIVLNFEPLHKDSSRDESSFFAPGKNGAEGFEPHDLRPFEPILW